MTDVASFYDDYAERQAAVGINDRHHSILRSLRRFGLQANHEVLEIGCGIGTLTELIAEQLNGGGRLLGMDLSPKSIEIAKERLARFTNLQLSAGNATITHFDRLFDVVVLPDVIEHIPIEDHSALFATVASCVKPDGFVLLHYPNPHHLQWVREHRPHLLQVVDQSIHADLLVSNAYSHGLYLDYYERYSIWVREGDYIVAVLRPASGVAEFHDLPEPKPSIRTRAIAKSRLMASAALNKAHRS